MSIFFANNQLAYFIFYAILLVKLFNKRSNIMNDQNLTTTPPEIKKWNWGAFSFNMIWGIGNHAYLTLLCLVPFLNIIWIFVCGANGNRWAWESGKFKNVEEFLAVQKTWNRAGLFVFILQIVLIIPLILIMLAGAAFYSINMPSTY
jgi:hypothetical protein